MSEEQDDAGPGLEPLLEYLRDGRGFDFTGYKRASLGRRIRKRMGEVGVDTYADYLDYLQAHANEVSSLFDTILINVTAFWRDIEHWEYLRGHVLPDLLALAGEDGTIRVWSAGCSSGEEAYTLAMLFCEVMGVETFKERVKIYATDVDEAALEQARRGSYEKRHLDEMPEALVEKYFEPNGVRYDFRRDVRRAVIFGRHDLAQDAPISRIDLLVCRNLLMYFTAETQSRILSRLHFALRDTGYLFLGRAEMLLTRTHLFTPADLKHRIFTKSMARTPDDDLKRDPIPLAVPAAPSRSVRLRDATFMESPGAQFVVDQSGVLTHANLTARRMFELAPSHIGRLFSDLEVSYRPIELRGHMEEAYRNRHTVRLRNIARVGPDGAVQHLDVALTPLTDPEGQLLGMLIAFADVSDYERLRADLQRSNHDLETAYEELQSTNEELLTTNEELQSTIEELETTNEELQSANEELETMNEELQSSNLEQEEVNAELNRRGEEVARANELLQAIMTAFDSAVIVVDKDARVRVWDGVSADTWGLRPDEVAGQQLTDLDCGLPTDELLPHVRTCADSGVAARASVKAMNRLGRNVVCDVRFEPIGASAIDRGVVMLIDTREIT